MSTKKTIAKSFTVSTIEDGVSVQAQYAPNANPTSGQIHTVWQEGDLYMRTRESDESAWSSWHKIVGESGDETDFSFGISQYKTTANASTAPSDISSWSDAPLAVTTAKPYLWAKVQQKSWNASTQAYVVDSTRYIRLTGEDGYTVEAQYAPNNNPTSSQIHTTWQDGDLYMRTKQSNETTWSSWHKIVGESGDETDYTFNISKSLTSTNATTAPSNCYYNTWQDAPIAPTSTYPYLWMKVVKKTWNESTQSYDSGTPSYARITGEAGDDAPTALANPDKISIPCNTDGSVTSPLTKSVTFSLKVGTHSATVTGVSAGTKPTGVTVTGQADNAVTITIATTATASGLSAGVTFTVTGTYGGKTYSATVTVALIGTSKGNEGKGYKAVVTRNNFTESNWNTYGTSGHSETWSDTSSIRGNCKTGDWFIVVGTATDTKNYHIATYECTNDSGNLAGTCINHQITKDGQSYCFVFTSAFAKTDENGIVSAALSGYAYKYVGGVRSALASTTIRYGYILTDSDTYVDTTTNSSGFFDDGTWFNGDDIATYGKNSPSIFAAIIIGGSIVHAEFVTISQKGETGSRGKTGRFYYYAQEWSDDSSISYSVTDAEAPYFFYNDNYWVFNPTANGNYTMHQMGTPSSSSDNWKLMVTDFKFIITEAIFGQYAHFGSAIINGDWMISANGKVDGTTYSSTAKVTGNRITTSTTVAFSIAAYTLFDNTQPLNDQEAVVSGSTAITISASETTKAITTQYLYSGRTYKLNLTAKKNSSDSTVYVRIRNNTYGSYQCIYIPYTYNYSHDVVFQVTTSESYTIEMYQPDLPSSSSGGATVASYSLKRLLFSPSYAVDLLTGETYQTQIYASGGLRSPFTYINKYGTLSSKFNDNCALYSDAGSSWGSDSYFYIPWDKTQSGRKMVLTNYKWNGTEQPTEGYAYINAPSGQYFYEDGIRKSTLRLSREGVELLGFGDTTTFYGWIVVKRFDLVTNKRYGRGLKVLAMGRVSVDSSGNVSVAQHTFDGTSISCTRNSAGNYTVTMPNKWYADSGKVLPIITPFGYTKSGGSSTSKPCMATHIQTDSATSIIVKTFDKDNVDVDGSFDFLFINFDDWIYIESSVDNA